MITLLDVLGVTKEEAEEMWGASVQCNLREHTGPFHIQKCNRLPSKEYVDERARPFGDYFIKIGILPVREWKCGFKKDNR